MLFWLNGLGPCSRCHHHHSLQCMPRQYGILDSENCLWVRLSNTESARGGRSHFFFEALCVCATIHWVVNKLSPELQKCITIFTDNTNTVDIFNSLRASPNYNPILKSAVDVMISHSIDLHILHIPGSENDVADALSCSQFSRALDLVPRLIILPLKPPLGASKCW